MELRQLPRRLLPVVVLLIAVVTLSRAEVAPARQPDPMPLVARVTVRDQAEADRLAGLGLDLLEMREGDDLFVLVTLEQIERLRAQGWQIVVDEEQTALLTSQSAAGPPPGYRTASELQAALQDAALRFPHLAELFVYGSSYEGRDLFGLTLTNRARSEPKPTFFLMAAIHAREIATPELVLRLVDHLLDGYGVDGDVTWLLDEHRIVVVPVANPDGHRLAMEGYYQRKNTNRSHNSGGETCLDPPQWHNHNGVDLNRNSSFQWGTVNRPTEDKCGQTYPGPVAASEAETLALQQLLDSLFPDQRGPDLDDAAPIDATGIMITLHSFSDLVLYPWGWTSAPAPNATELGLIAGRLAQYNGYTPGQPGVLLYNASGTTDDWSYGELGIASFTFEVGPASGTCSGFMPNYSCIDGSNGVSRNFWAENRPALLYAARIAREPYRLAHGPAPEALTVTATSTATVTLLAEFDEQANGNQAIAAAEYYVDVPPWRGGTPLALSPADGDFNSATEAATAVVTPLRGRHLIYVRARDSLGQWGPVRAVLVTVPAEVQRWLPQVRR